MNLACKAILGAITDMDFAAPEADDFVPPLDPADNFLAAVGGDPVATIRTTVRVVRQSVDPTFAQLMTDRSGRLLYGVSIFRRYSRLCNRKTFSSSEMLIPGGLRLSL